MKRREITITGLVNNDGELAMYIGELREFLKLHKGARVIARFSVAQPGTSEALRGYYYNYIVPTFKQAIWDAGERKNYEQVDIFLRELSPIMHEQDADINSGKYTTRLRAITELSNAELIEHIETLKQIGAEEYSIYIEDPSTI